MKKKETFKKRAFKKVAITTCSITVFLILATAPYINDYYHAKDMALQSIENPAEGVTVSRQDNLWIFAPKEAKAGIIFYPGGKVEAVSYAPLMECFAQEGILSVLVSMPGNLAVLNSDAANGVPEKFPEVESWYMAGHSLGGSMAASYLGTSEEQFEGLILLASYSIEDLSDTDLSVLSVYGENDGVLNFEKYEENKENLPVDWKEVVIPGGCHAYFGDYGEQEGDGMAEITVEEQIRITTKEVSAFVIDKE